MYCVDDDSLCCSICVHLKHRTCKQVKHVEEVAKGIRQNLKFKHLASDACTPQLSLKKFREKRTKNIELLQTVSNEIKESFRKIRQIMDKLEKKSSEELDRLRCILEDGLKSEIDAATRVYEKIAGLLEKLEDIESDNETLAFQAFKCCQQSMTDAEQLLSTTQPEDFQLTFTLDSRIAQNLFSMSDLGQFNVLPYLPVSDINHVYSISTEQLHTVKLSEDKSTCDITGLCQLPDGQKAIVDSGNRKVKLLNPVTFSVTTEHKIPSDIWDICQTTGTELAVTACSVKKGEVIFLNVEDGKLSNAKSVKLKNINGLCKSISYHDSLLYLGWDKSVFMYTSTGQLLKTLHTLKSAFDWFTFSLVENGSKLYIADSNGCVKTIDCGGNELSCFQDPNLKWSAGMCLADNGTVFVSGLRSHTIHQFDSDGTGMLSTLAAAKDGLEKPVSLCYDKGSRQLLVGQINSNKLLVYKLK